MIVVIFVSFFIAAYDVKVKMVCIVCMVDMYPKITKYSK
jgi:glutamate dehydrogenase/leucine dehydrogenase